MDTLTISQAMIKLSDLEKLRRDKFDKLQDINNTTVKYILESDNQKHICNEPFEFEKELNEFFELSNQICNVKTEIAKSNSNIQIEVLGTKMSIQGALNNIRFLREEEYMLENILNTSKSSKVRKVDAAATSFYYSVCEPNFNRNNLQNKLDEIKANLLEMELAINKANNENTITLA